VQVKTTPIEAKNSYFANVKSNNYLQNALAVMDAESEECDQVQSLIASAGVDACCHAASSQKQGFRMCAATTR